MAPQIIHLKEQLEHTNGPQRLSALTQLLNQPTFWGDKKEPACIKEAFFLVADYDTELAAEVNLLAGRFHMRNVRYNDATLFLETAGNIYKQLNDKHKEVDCLTELCTIESRRANYYNCLQRAEDLLLLSRAIDYTACTIRLLNLKAFTNDSLGKYNEAMADCKTALALALSSNNSPGIATSHFFIASVNESQGNYTEALSNYLFALEIREDIGDRYNIAKCYNNIGNVHWAQSNHPEALKNHLQALRIEEDIEDRNGVALSYINIGNIHSNLENYKEALEYYRPCLIFFEKSDNRSVLSAVYYNIGIAQKQLREFGESLKNHLLALKLREDIGDQEGICSSHNYIGNIYSEMGDYPLGLEYQLKAIKLAEAIGNKRRVGIALASAGETYDNLNKYDLAIEHLNRAHAVGKEIGDKGIERDALRCLTNIYKKTANYKKALEYHELYHQMDKDISGEQAIKQLATLNFQHNILLKEKEAALLKDKNAEVERYVHKLEISNNELKQFAHVAAHDLREPLRMITSYMQLLNNSFKGNLDEQQKEFIHFAVDGSKRMMNLLNDMLRLAKVDANPKLEKIELTGVIDEIQKNLTALMAEKNAQIISATLPPVTADRTQMLQLFQNIISNGIKYNEHEVPTVNITAHIISEGLEISIADNGIGIPEHYREKAFHIFQRVPTNRNYSGSGIGLAICKKIADSMNGRLWIEDNIGGGTIFKIALPQNILS